MYFGILTSRSTWSRGQLRSSLNTTTSSLRYTLRNSTSVSGLHAACLAGSNLSLLLGLYLLLRVHSVDADSHDVNHVPQKLAWIQILLAVHKHFVNNGKGIGRLLYLSHVEGDNLQEAVLVLLGPS